MVGELAGIAEDCPAVTIATWHSLHQGRMAGNPRVITTRDGSERAHGITIVSERPICTFRTSGVTISDSETQNFTIGAFTIMKLKSTMRLVFVPSGSQ